MTLFFMQGNRLKQTRLHRLLGALLSQKLTVEEKLTIMETEYHIPVEENLREGCECYVQFGRRN